MDSMDQSAADKPHTDARVMLPSLDRQAVFQFLQERGEPVHETELLRRFRPEQADESLGGGISLDLYRAHFVLYHHLYRLAGELEGTPWFLHIRSVKVALLRRPAEGRCQFFHEERGVFCEAPAAGTGLYCGRHQREIREHGEAGTVGAVSMASYYLDPENYRSMDEGKLERMTRGVFYYAANQEEIEQAREQMGLSADFSPERLRRRYLYLSKLAHPDRNGGDNAPFQELQKSYRILLAEVNSRRGED